MAGVGTSRSLADYLKSPSPRVKCLLLSALCFAFRDWLTPFDTVTASGVAPSSLVAGSVIDHVGVPFWI